MNPVGRVYARHNQMADIATPDGTVRRVRLQRRLGDLACGDRVELDAEDGAILRRLERDNTLQRRDSFKRLRTVAANIDCVWVVIAPAPAPARFLIDRFLTAIHNLPARPRLLINKQDTFATPDSAWLAPYRHLDLEPLCVSARTGFGLTALAQAAVDRTHILVGQSGVGKSSLIAALLREHGLPDAVAPRTDHLGASGEGRHTTVTAQWYPMRKGGAWIDSPGVRDFIPEITSLENLKQGFPDLTEYARDCRFRNCRHAGEPGCAVRAAVDTGILPAARLTAWESLAANLEPSRS